MRKRTITNSAIMAFEKHLKNDEKSENTVVKYLHDLYYFLNFTQGKPIDKSMMLDYKALLGEQYAPSSANSMIAAVNAFLRFMDWVDCCIKQFKVQKKAFCSEEKELTKAEYICVMFITQRRKIIDFHAANSLIMYANGGSIKLFQLSPFNTF